MAAGSARSTALLSPHSGSRAPGLGLLRAKPARELVVRRDRERHRVPALDEHLVEEPPVLEPDIREEPAVAVPRLAPDLVPHARARMQDRLREGGRLRAEALDVAVDLRGVDPDQPDAAEPNEPHGVAVDHPLHTGAVGLVE